MKKNGLATFATILLMMASTSFAGDVATGKALSAKCAACHGANGISVNPMSPNLAGKDIAYLEEKMKGYRDGTIANPIMKSMVGGLSDEDINHLATYFNSLPAQ